MHEELSRPKRNASWIVKRRGCEGVVVGAACDLGYPEKFALCRSGRGMC